MTGMEEAKCVHGKKVQNIGFLKKPFTIDEIEKTISQYLKQNFSKYDFCWETINVV